MDKVKNDAYFVEKILTDLRFIAKHMDGVTQEKLEQIVPDDFAHHWQDVLSLFFLCVFLQCWLKEKVILLFLESWNSG